MNLYNLGLSGINAANARLNTTGHNINNMDTEGYNRQRVVVSTAGGASTSSGYFGRGVQVDTVSRQHSNFLYTQLASARSQQSALSTYSGQLAQVNDLFGTRTQGVSPALENFFNSVNAVASEPSDPAARQEMLGRAASLVTQINEAQRMLDEQASGINTQIGTVVDQVNSYVARISNLNQQVTTALSGNGAHQPNDLLDQRDQLVTELGQLIGVQTSANGASINLTTGSGQVLLSGDTVFPLRAGASAADPARTVVSYTMPAPGGALRAVEFDEDRLSGGQLGGLLQFRRESLDTVRNDLGRMAVGLASSFNALNRQGITLTGGAGQDIFSVGAPTAYRHEGNAGGAQVGAVIANDGQLAASDYDVAYVRDSASGADYYRITRSTDGAVLTTPQSAPAGGATLTLDGLEITLPDAAASGVQAGDRWTLQPTREAAKTLALALGDPSGIAAASAAGGATNNENALEMAKLQTRSTLANGTLSLTGAFSQIVNKVGVAAQSVGAAKTAADNLATQRLTAQQDLSGVTLEEEQISLLQYAEQYQSSSRLISVASELFDTLLGLR